MAFVRIVYFCIVFLIFHYVTRVRADLDGSNITIDCSKYSLLDGETRLTTETGTQILIKQTIKDNNTQAFQLNLIANESEFQLNIDVDAESRIAYAYLDDSEPITLNYSFPIRLSFREKRITSNLGLIASLKEELADNESFDLELTLSHVYFNCRQRCFKRELDLEEIFEAREKSTFFVKSGLFKSSVDFSASLCGASHSVHVLPSSQVVECTRNVSTLPLFNLTDQWAKIEFYSWRVRGFINITTIAIDDGDPLYFGDYSQSLMVYFEIPDSFAPHWVMDCLPDDVDFPDEFKLLFGAKGLFIYDISSSKKLPQPLLGNDDDRNIIGVDYDWRSNCFFWTMVGPTKSVEKICRGQRYKLLKGEDAEGLAIDWITGNIYWTSKRKSKISVSDRRGWHQKTLVDKLYSPRGLALNPFHGYLYWTDWGEVPSIGKAGMDGSNPAAIITTNVRWPNSITIDFDAQEIYWCDGGLDFIAKADLNGNNMRIVKKFERSIHMFGVSVYKRMLFFTDWRSNPIEKLDLDANTTTQILRRTDQFSRIMGIKVVHPSLQPSMPENPCEGGGGCDALCLLAPGNRRTCACPANSTLAEDEVSCRKTG